MSLVVSARPTDGQELFDVLRLCYRSLASMSTGQFGDCILSWLPILESYRNSRCPAQFYPDLNSLIYSMRQFEEFWDAPDTEIDSFLDILGFLSHLLG